MKGSGRFCMRLENERYADSHPGYRYDCGSSKDVHCLDCCGLPLSLSSRGFFKCSKIVVSNRHNWASVGLLGRVMRIGAISAMLSMSRFCVGKGLVDPGEVETVPDQIKKLLVTLWLLHLLLLESLIVLCLWIGTFRS